jgi:hypothetical protein
MKKLFLLFVVTALSFTVFGQKRMMQVKTIQDKLNEEYCSGIFKMVDGTYFDLLDDRINSSAMGYTNALDWLQGRVAGLQIYTTYDRIRVPYIRNQRAGVYVDEVPVSEDFLSMLPVSDIAMIKVIKDPLISGWRGPGGAIAIYTIRGEDDEDLED